MIGKAMVLLAMMLTVSGCENGLAVQQARLQHLVGQKLDTLIATEGVPDHAFRADGVTYLDYLRQRIDLERPLPMSGPPWMWGWYPEPPQVAVRRACETIFAVKGGIVQGFALRGNACG